MTDTHDVENKTIDGGSQPICDQCAVLHGGKPRKSSHQATITSTTCSLCGESRECTLVGDWSWPVGPHENGESA